MNTFYVIRHQGPSTDSADIGVAVEMAPNGRTEIQIGPGSISGRITLDAGEARELATLILEELADRFEVTR